MKKTLIILLMCFAFVAGHAQNKAVRKAESYLKKGELAQAKEQIDQAVAHEKTSDDAKTYYIKGQVYSAIATAEDEQVQNLASESLQEATKAYQKAMELEGKETSTYYVFSEQGIDQLWGQFLNTAIAVYNDSTRSEDPTRFDESLTYLDKALAVKPQDSVTNMVAGIIAQDKGDRDRAAEYFYTVVENEQASPEVINSLISYERDEKENFEKARELIKAAQEQFPDEVNFKKQEVSLLLKMGKTAEAKEELKAAIEAEPTNADLYFNLGYLNEQLEDKQAAIEAYKKAMEVDPSHANAAYNLAVIHYTRAADLVKEANNLGISAADRKKEKELLKNSKIRFEEALPYLEKALELHPENRTMMEITMIAYDHAGHKERAKELQKQVDSLPAPAEN